MNKIVEAKQKGFVEGQLFTSPSGMINCYVRGTVKWRDKDIVHDFYGVIYCAKTDKWATLQTEGRI